MLPDAEHLMAYHILISGTCWAGLEGGQQVCMQPGDAIMFPHGDAHAMSGREMLGVSVDRLSATSTKRYPETVLLGPSDTMLTRMAELMPSNCCATTSSSYRPNTPDGSRDRATTSWVPRSRSCTNTRRTRGRSPSWRDRSRRSATSHRPRIDRAMSVLSAEE